MWDRAGMRRPRFHAGHPDILAKLRRQDGAKGLLDVAQACNRENASSGLKTLGIRYSAATDSFNFSMLPPDDVGAWSKRKMLKTFPQLFDPLGLLLPFNINARIAFSKANKQQKDWDAPVQVVDRWTNWLEDLPSVGNVTFPRCIKITVPERAKLHLFADASAEAYAAAAYVVVVSANDSSSLLVMAKAHVTPPKVSTIPRLELLAAELPANLRVSLLTKL